MSIYGNMLQESYNEYKESEYLEEGLKEFFGKVKSKFSKLFKGKSEEEKEKEKELKQSLNLGKFVKMDGQMHGGFALESTDVVNELFGIGEKKPKDGETKVGNYIIKVIGMTSSGEMVAKCDKIKISNAETFLYGNKFYSLMNPNVLADLDKICSMYSSSASTILAKGAEILNKKFPDANIRLTTSDISRGESWIEWSNENNSGIVFAQAVIHKDNITKRKEGDRGVYVSLYAITRTGDMYIAAGAINK